MIHLFENFEPNIVFDKLFYSIAVWEPWWATKSAEGLNENLVILAWILENLKIDAYFPTFLRFLLIFQTFPNAFDCWLILEQLETFLADIV